MSRRLMRIAIWVLGSIVLVEVSSHAFAKDFYEGKTIRFIVSSPPGGGYDLYSRLLARHLLKHMASVRRVDPIAIAEAIQISQGANNGIFSSHRRRLPR